MIEYIVISYIFMCGVMFACFACGEYKLGIKGFIFAPISILIGAPMAFMAFVGWLFK